MKHRKVPGATWIFVAVMVVFNAGYAQDDRCTALSKPALFADTVVTSTTTMTMAPNGAPAFCEIDAVISSATDSHVGVVYRLPAQWNGKLLGLGGGGWMGNISLNGAMAGLTRGYATMQTDTGHPIDSGFDTRWAIGASGTPNTAAIEDFGYRAVHLMTEVGKQVAAAYYGKQQTRAYWQGCSTGGRQGFMEVQRYPDDYDGVIAGAPVYDLLTTTGALTRYNNFASPQRRLAPTHLELLNRAVLKACDQLDGKPDGIVVDPRACHWDPKELQCKAGQSGDTCLTSDQVDAVRVAYAGVKTQDGHVAAYPLSRGGELGWTRFAFATEEPPGDNASVGMNGLRAALFDDADYDLRRFDVNRDVARARSSTLANTYEAIDPNLSAFVRHGGKLIIWHGFYDPGPGPTGTIAYYEQARRATQTSTDIDQSIRLFLAPGVAHCGGGPGPDRIDFLSALDKWVEQDKAPTQITATKQNSTLTWPVCAYPALPRGDARNQGVSYTCK